MRLRCSLRILPLVLILGLLAPAAGGAGATPFSAADLVRLERISDPQLAPDGSQVAFAVWEGADEESGAPTAVPTACGCATCAGPIRERTA